METIDFYLSGDGSVSSDNTEGYEVKISLSRIRDNVSGRERLLAAIYEKADSTEAYAVAYCSTLDLQRDLYKLREYGAMISRKEIMLMAMTIERQYNKLVCRVDNSVPTLDSCMQEILSFICGYIRELGLEAKTVGTNEIYCISVNDFREHFKGSVYARFRQRDIRRKLRDLGYTCCSPGRYDYTDSVDGIAFKVIAVYADEPDVLDILQEIDERTAGQ